MRARNRVLAGLAVLACAGSLLIPAGAASAADAAASPAAAAQKPGPPGFISEGQIESAEVKGYCLAHFAKDFVGIEPCAPERHAPASQIWRALRFPGVLLVGLGPKGATGKCLGTPAQGGFAVVNQCAGGHNDKPHSYHLALGGQADGGVAITAPYFGNRELCGQTSRKVQGLRWFAKTPDHAACHFIFLTRWKRA